MDSTSGAVPRVVCGLAGEKTGSWIASGENQAVSGEQLTTVLCPYPMAGVAENLGLSKGDATGQLSSLLPGLIDKLTPNCTVPNGWPGQRGRLDGYVGRPITNALK